MEKVFEDYFNETEGKSFNFNGKKISLSFKIEVKKNISYSILNLKTNSKWKQGIFLSSNKNIFLESVFNNKIVLWEDTILNETNFYFKENATLFIGNVWDVGNGIMQYGHNGAGLYVDEKKGVFSFFCNDGFPDFDLNDLTFDLVVGKVVDNGVE